MADSPVKAKKQAPSTAMPSAKAEDRAEDSTMADGEGGAPSDDSDDEVADFRNLLPQLLADKGASAGSDNGIQSISIPKRGEKDFEPTGFRGQERKLEESRRAMEMVISQSRRYGR
jgi:tRNA-splicing endonuclease subunit Sen54